MGCEAWEATAQWAMTVLSPAAVVDIGTSSACIDFLSLLASFCHHHPQENDTESTRGTENSSLTLLEDGREDVDLNHLLLQ